MNLEKLIKVLTDAKGIIATIAIICTSLIGGYQVITDTFVTKAVAADMVKDAQTQIHELKQISQQNTSMIIELRLLKYEQKVEDGYSLSPTESREYDILKKRLETMNTVPQN